jgi:hypothetical protein
MLYSAHFAERAEHYRKLAERAPNGRQAEFQLSLANLFLAMSCDMQLRELGLQISKAVSGYGPESGMRRFVR